jgi:hypothetical protein
MPSPMITGLGFGIALGFAGAFGGIVAFIVVLVVGLAGLVAGAIYEGRIDLTYYLGGRARRDSERGVRSRGSGL